MDVPVIPPGRRRAHGAKRAFGEAVRATSFEWMDRGAVMKMVAYGMIRTMQQGQGKKVPRTQYLCNRAI